MNLAEINTSCHCSPPPPASWSGKPATSAVCVGQAFLPAPSCVVVGQARHLRRLRWESIPPSLHSSTTPRPLRRLRWASIPPLPQLLLLLQLLHHPEYHSGHQGFGEACGIYHTFVGDFFNFPFNSKIRNYRNSKAWKRGMTGNNGLRHC